MPEDQARTVSHKALEAYLYARSVRLYTRANGALRSLGTGFLLEYQGAGYVVTAGHCLSTYLELRKANADAVIDVSAGSGSQAVALTSVIHARKANVSDLADPRNRDIGILPLSSIERDHLVRHKQFFSQAFIDVNPLTQGSSVYFFGFSGKAHVYPEDEQPNSVHKGKLYGTETRAQDRSLIEMVGFVQSFGIGDDELRGVSGAALVDQDARIRGIILGGLETQDRIYAWNIADALALIQEPPSPQPT